MKNLYHQSKNNQYFFRVKRFRYYKSFYNYYQRKCIVAILRNSIFWIYCYLSIFICLQCVKNYEWCALLLDNDQVQQSPMYFNRLQYLERLFIDSSVSCTSPQQCLPRMKNDVKLHKGKAVLTPSASVLPFL